MHYPNFRVLVVDNGSLEHDGESLAARYPEIDTLRLPENKGFAGGCNAGLEHCLEQSADFVWLLNNDTTVYGDTLTCLVRAANTNQRAGAVGASLVNRNADTPGVTIFGPGKIDYTNCKTELKKGTVDEALECQWLSGSNLLLRAEAVRHVGAFNEDYFLYFEDVDLCVRLLQSGWQCVLEPKARVDHCESSSMTGARENLALLLLCS